MLCRVAGKYKTYLKNNDFYLLLKGQSHDIFCIRFFYESNDFETSRRYLQVEVLQVLLIPVTNLPPVSKTPVVHIDLRISPQIVEKIRNGRNGILRLGGN